MNTEQLKHHEGPLKKPVASVILVCDAITSPANSGALMCLSDAFDVEQLFLCGHKADLESNRLKKTARSTEKHVAISQQGDSISVLNEFEDIGFKLVGQEITSTRQALQNYTVGEVKPFLYWAMKKKSITEEVISMLDDTLHITMYGKNSSMNVSQAAAVALYELTKPRPHEN